MKRSSTIILILLALIINTHNSNAAQTWYFYESFEYSESITNWGWEIFDAGDPSGIAQTSIIASAFGGRGLQMRSTPNGVFSITYFLDINYHHEMSIDMQVYNVQNSASIRIALSDVIGNNMFLDYGPSISGWEPFDIIYDVQSEFPEGQWTGLNRDLQDDIDMALDDPNSPFEIFEVDKILDINIFQDGDGGFEREVYLDELKLINPAGINLERTQTTTTTFYVTQEGRNELARAPPSDASAVLGWTLFFIALITIIIDKFGRPKVKTSVKPGNIDENSKLIKSHVSLKCTFCGLVNEPSAEYCGNCGRQI